VEMHAALRDIDLHPSGAPSAGRGGQRSRDADRRPRSATATGEIRATIRLRFVIACSLRASRTWRNAYTRERAAHPPLGFAPPPPHARYRAYMSRNDA